STSIHDVFSYDASSNTYVTFYFLPYCFHQVQHSFPTRRSSDLLIWATTRGGPGFASDVLGSVIYKQYQAGFYGLSTAGNVVLFLVVTAIMIPVTILLKKREVEQ